MSDLDVEAKMLYEKLLMLLSTNTDEEFSISDFFEKYASDEFKENSRKLEERRKRLYDKGIIEG